MILVALGSNLRSQAGLPAQTLDAACASLTRNGVHIAAVSPYYVTPAWPEPSDPPFVNAVARVETDLAPHALMELLHTTETEFGRVRSVRNAPRMLDLDLLSYCGRIEEGPPILPHPRLAERAFVLVPLFDIAPDWKHPVTGRTVREMLDALAPRERGAAMPISRA